MTQQDPAGADLWEVHADWWQAGFTEGADPEYTEQILPLAAELLDGAEAVLDIGTGEGQIARLACATGSSRVIGVGCDTSKRRRSGAFRLPFCWTCVPNRRRSDSCSRCVAL